MNIFNFKFYKENFSEFLFITGTLIVFLYCSFSNLHLPGLGRDEVVTPFWALLYLIKNDFSLSNFIHNFSFSNLMVDPHHDSILGFLYVFIFYFFGVSVFVFRFVSVFLGLVFLLFFYFFVKGFFNRRVAMFSLVLVSTVPSMIFCIRTNINLHFWLVPGFGCLLFFLRFYKKRRLLDLGVGSLFLGLGFSNNIIFWWFILALNIAFFLLVKNFYFRKKEFIVGFLFFLLGASPMLLWNMSVPFECNTVSYILTRAQGNIPFLDFVSFLRYDTNCFQKIRIPKFELNLWNNLVMRFNQMKSILGDMFSWWFFLIAFIFSLLIVSLGIIKKSKNILFILIMILAIFLESTILSLGYSRHHMLILIPFCLILSARLLDYLYKHSKILTYFLLSLIVVSNFLIFIGSYNDFILGLYNKPLYDLRGLNAKFDSPSENIYHLAEYLQENKIYRPINIADMRGYEIKSSLAFLTFLKVRPVDLIEKVDYNKSALLDELKKEFSSPDKMFIVNNVELSSDIVKSIQNMIEDLNKTMVINKTFSLRNGDLEYLLFQVRDQFLKS